MISTANEVRQIADNRYEVTGSDGKTHAVTYRGSGDGDPDQLALWECDCDAAQNWLATELVKTTAKLQHAVHVAIEIATRELVAEMRPLMPPNDYTPAQHLLLDKLRAVELAAHNADWLAREASKYAKPADTCDCEHMRVVIAMMDG